MKAYSVALSSIVSLLTVAAPAKTAVIDFRSNLLTQAIEAEWQSPAYAALEDARVNIGDVALETKTIHQEHVRVGLNLKSFLRRKNDAAVAVVREPLRPLVVSSQTIAKQMNEQRPAAKTDYLAELIRTYKVEPEVYSVTQRAEQLVDEELARREQASPSNNEYVRSIKTAAGKEITVAKPVHIVAGPTAPNFSTQAKKSGDEPIKTITLAAAPKVNVVPQPVREVGEYRLQGNIRFAGGAAIVDPTDEIVIHQIVDGLTVAQGQININEAKYRITVNQLEGELQALLQGRDGQLRGIGHVSVYDVVAKHRGQTRIAEQEIVLRPAANALSGTVISAASYGKTIFNLADAKIKIMDLDREVLRNKQKNEFEDQDIMLPSTAIVAAKQNNFWPSLAMVESGRKFQIRLFPTSLVEAFLSLIHDKYEAREALNEGIIWGRVSYGGRPVEGARVFLVGENQVKPTYFNGFLPDKNREMTATRGEFAFSRLTQDQELIRVVLGMKTYWPILVPTENRHIYYADLEAQPTKNLELKSFDAFTLEPRAAIAQPLGTSEEIVISAEGRARTTADILRGLTFIESQAGEGYAPTRVELKSHQSEVQLAHVKSEWITKIYNHEGTVGANYQSSVVGFVEGEDYDVLVGSGTTQAGQKTVYFNYKGEPLSGKHGDSGGGFAIFNLPHGLNTITILPKSSRRVITQTVYVDEFATHTLRLSLQN